MSPKLKFLIGGIVVVAVIGFWIALALGVTLLGVGLGGSTSDYLTIAQAKALGPDQSRNSRVAGAIVPDSIVWSTREVRLTFEILDETGSLAISYHGPQPDMLIDAVEAVAIGKYDPVAQVFEADELLMKCPSKYEEEQ